MQDEPFFPDLSESEWEEIFEHEARMEAYDSIRDYPISLACEVIKMISEV